jgi:hypothetical protein
MIRRVAYAAGELVIELTCEHHECLSAQAATNLGNTKTSDLLSIGFCLPLRLLFYRSNS